MGEIPYIFTNQKSKMAEYKKTRVKIEKPISQEPIKILE